MSTNIHALLVAINNYHPQAKVRKLRGCINDLQSIQNLLTTQYNCSKEQIVTLINEAATRENLLTTFQEHLCANPAIQTGDIVLFYFSGHGSYAKTAVEFEPFDAQRKDETLVCYDSRIPQKGYYDLTDKELSVLLSRVKPGVEIVVIADACHSDSITRDSVSEDNTFVSRYLPQREVARSLDSYLLPNDDFYSKMQEIEIPHRQHLVLSACTREQKAYEKNGQGLFTKHLVKTLKNTDGRVSYRQLYERTSLGVRTAVKNQTPQIYPPNNFDIYKVFLGKDRIESIPPYEIKYKNEQWCLNHGAIYGLRTDQEAISQMKIAVYLPLINGEKTRRYLGNTDVKAVKLKECHLAPNLFEAYCTPLLKGLPEYMHKREKGKYAFEAEIISVLPNLSVYLNGSSNEQNNFMEAITSLKKDGSKSVSPYIQCVTELSGQSYELLLSSNEYLIKNRVTDQLIHGYRGYQEDAIPYILGKLAQLEEWERIAHLENKESLIDQTKIETRFLEEGQNRYYEAPVIHLNYTNKSILFQIQVRNLSGRDLYIGLIHLSPKFGVESFYACEKFPASNTDWITLDKRHVLAIKSDKDHSVSDIFKIIISTESFDDYRFFHKDIALGTIIDLEDLISLEDSTRGTIEREHPATNIPESDWFTHTITTHLTRQKKQLSKEDTPINGLVFKGHPSFSASVGFGSLHINTKSTNPANSLEELFVGDGFEFINFSPDANNKDQSILHINDIEAALGLLQHPLEIVLATNSDSTSHLLPLTYDGEHVLPVGELFTNKERQTIIKVRDLPVTEAPYIEVEEQTRSVTRSLWFCMLKFTGHKAQAFRLNYIWEYRNNLPIYGNLPTTDIKNKVSKAKNILLVIHGIIGDTYNIAKAVQPLVENGTYPLVLSFDYENLNTPIETIAEILHEALNEVGLDSNSSKRIDVVAHSMGGLVIRYLIERIRKNHPLVEKLLLFGTPNGGSLFSNLTKLRDVATGMLLLAANGAKYLLPTIAPWLYGVNGLVGSTKLFSPTLEQMHPDAPFIKGMKYNDLQPATQYHIIAGNFDKYQPTGNWLAGLVEKMTTTSLNFVYKATASDLIVSVAQVLDVPEGDNVQSYEIGGYHMNYFEGEGINLLLNILEDKSMEYYLVETNINDEQ